MKQIIPFVLALSFSITVVSQTKITGTVSDDIDVLSNANIIIKGTETGTSTNLNGSFQLEVKKDDTLSISYLGYVTKDIIIKNQKTINAILDVDSFIDEVVITVYSIKREERVIACRKMGVFCGVSCSGVKIIQEEDVELNKVILYPNPSLTGYFNLKFLKKYKKIEIQITNISGQIIQSKIFQNVNNLKQIDLSKFSSGIYIINIIADEKKLPTKKAIIG